MAILLSSLTDAELLAYFDTSSGRPPMELELAKRLRASNEQVVTQEKKIDELEDRISELESEIDDLEEELAGL